MSIPPPAPEANLPAPAEQGSSEARLFIGVRWLLFLIASLGLVGGNAALLQLLYVFLTQDQMNVWYTNLQLGLPALGFFVGAAAGVAFLALSAATLVGPRFLEGTAASPDRPIFGVLPWLTARRLRRAAFWAIFLTGAAAMGGSMRWGQLGTVMSALLQEPRYWLHQLNFVFSPLFFGAFGAAALSLGVGASLTPGDRRLALAAPQPPAPGSLPPVDDAPPAPDGPDAVAFVAHDAVPLAAARCPVCGTDVAKAPRTCPRCGTPHHPECWDYAGGCAIFGCAPREGRPPAAPGAFADLGRAATLWSRVYRVQWGAFCVATLGMLAFVAGHALPNAYALEGTTVLGTLWLLGSWLWKGGALTAAGAVLVWLLALWPEARLRHVLKEQVQEPIEPARGEGRALVERLDVAPPDQALHAALGAATVLMFLLFLVLPLLAWSCPGAWFPEFSTVGRWVSLVFGATLPVGVLAAARRRLRHVASIQNRVEASLALAKDKAPPVPGGGRPG